MILDLNERQERLRAHAESFATREVAPLAASIDERNALPMELIRQAARAGLTDFGLQDSPDGGGDRIAAAVALEAIARGNAALALRLGITQLVRSALHRFGAASQVRRWDPGLSSGVDAAAVIVAEPDASLERGADAIVVRDVHAAWVAALQVARVGVCVTVPRGSSRPAMAWIDALPGGDVQCVERPDPIGLRGAGWADATAALWRVDLGSVLGADPSTSHEAGPWVVAHARAVAAAVAVGIGRAALDHAVSMIRAREDRGSQAVRFALADASAELDAAWLLTLKAVSDAGTADAALASMAKFLASEAAVGAADTGLRLAAPDSYRRGSVAERLSRDARAIDAVFGTSDRARQDAARALGLAEG